MLISLRNCDCLEYMWALPDGYFDCVIADPPYGIGRDWEKRDWRARAIFIDKDGKENKWDQHQQITTTVTSPTGPFATS